MRGLLSRHQREHGQGHHDAETGRDPEPRPPSPVIDHESQRARRQQHADIADRQNHAGPQAKASSANTNARKLTPAFSVAPPSIDRPTPTTVQGGVTSMRTECHSRSRLARYAGRDDHFNRVQFLWNTSVRSSMLSRGGASAG